MSDRTRTARCKPPAPAVAVLAVLLLSVATNVATNAAIAQPSRVVAVPEIDWGWEMLEVRAFAQQQSVGDFDVFYDFQFTDRRRESGITFEHHSTSDSGKYYQPNHYDHGNSVVVADVDADGLYDIYFVTQLGANGLWKNQGGGRFTDITEQAGVALADRLSAAAAFADIDNDGDPDLYVTTVRMGNVLLLNDGQGHFRDATAGSGLEHTGHSSGAVFFDYDRDGQLDLFLTNVGSYTTDRRSPEGYWMGRGPWVDGGPDLNRVNPFRGHLYPELTEPSVLYRNLGGGRFEDASKKAGLEDQSWSGDATFTDLNGDGYLDLYVLSMQGDDHYYQNQGGRSFVERTADLFPKTPWGAMGVKFFDFDNDGDQDLYVTDMHSDMTRKVTPGYEKLKSLVNVPEAEMPGSDNNIFGNAFYENLGNGEFRERSDELGAENYWPWGISVDDLNADGWDDVFVASSMNFPFRYGINSLLLNNRGKKFLDSEFLLGIEPRMEMTRRPGYDPEQPWTVTKKPWFTLDCSGADRQHLMCGRRSGRFTVLANVGSRTSVLFDLDDDGDLDIVTGEFNDVPQVLISNLADKKAIHFLKIKLVGSASNRDGLGAKVEVRSGARTLTKVHDGKSGYLSQSLLPLYFGLGDASTVERVTVSWPSGRTQVITSGLATNRLLVVQEQ